MSPSTSPPRNCGCCSANDTFLSSIPLVRWLFVAWHWTCDTHTHRHRATLCDLFAFSRRLLTLSRVGPIVTLPPTGAGTNMRTLPYVATSMLFILACGGQEDEHEDDTNGDIGEISQPLLSTNTGNGNVANGAYWRRQFQKTAGYRYTFCIYPTAGNPDLYGDFNPDPTSAAGDYQFRSINGGQRPDCIAFTAGAAGTYYLAVKGIAAGQSSFSWRITSNNNNSVPAYLAGQLRRPLAFNVTTPKYGPFNSPWGNGTAPNDPFFPDGFVAPSTGYYHNAVDLAAAPRTNVTAGCNGTVKRIGSSSADGRWGYYVVIECPIGNQNWVTLAYVHLNQAGRPAENAPVVAGQTSMGTVFDMNVPGEMDHLHFAICTSTYAQCGAAHRGAKPATDASWTNMISPEAAGLYAP